MLGYRENGTDVIGVYPLLADGTCRFLVFDFDNHERDAAETDFANEDELWHDEVDALRLICKQNAIDALVERSSSGKGAHVWIFFQKPIPASLARNFGFLLLDKGATTINLKSFKLIAALASYIIEGIEQGRILVVDESKWCSAPCTCGCRCMGFLFGDFVDV